MTEVSDDKLFICNEKGLIPGPGESVESFVQRVEYCLKLSEHIENKLPFSVENEASSELIQEVCVYISPLYDIAPDWVPVFFSNYRLAPWHGGCAWIFQMSEEEPTAAFFQLRQGLKEAPTYLWFYNRTDLMAHEMAHVGRMMFEEPRFEEMLAYRTSKNRWRRWWGSLINSSAESAWFVFILLPIIFFDLYLLFAGYERYYWSVMWIKLLPLGLVLAAIIRLWRKHAVLERTLKKLTSISDSKTKAEAFLYRLTDKEIEIFSKMTVQEIVKYAESDSSLRWRVIKQAYMNLGVVFS